MSTGYHPTRPVHLGVEASKVSTHWCFQKGETVELKAQGAKMQGRKQQGPFWGGHHPGLSKDISHDSCSDHS